MLTAKRLHAVIGRDLSPTLDLQLAVNLEHPERRALWVRLEHIARRTRITTHHDLASRVIDHDDLKPRRATQDHLTCWAILEDAATNPKGDDARDRPTCTYRSPRGIVGLDDEECSRARSSRGARSRVFVDGACVLKQRGRRRTTGDHSSGGTVDFSIDNSSSPAGRGHATACVGECL